MVARQFAAEDVEGGSAGGAGLKSATSSELQLGPPAALRAPYSTFLSLSSLDAAIAGATGSDWRGRAQEQGAPLR
jgi:hypothetical protein